MMGKEFLLGFFGSRLGQVRVRRAACTFLMLPLTIFAVLPLATAAESAAVTRRTTTSPSGTKTILFIGDSIGEGYGVRKEEAFPEQVGTLLKAQGHDVKIINGSLSGSVSAAVDHRLNWYLKAKPDIFVLELGGNDALKGTPVNVIKANLAKAIELAQANKITVVLAGIKVFENYGKVYTEEFEKMYRDLAKEKKVTLIPFILEGVALDKNLNQADGKHPNARGHAIVAKTVVKYVEPLL
jgi:acyl-CoA thioesterase-1